MNSAKPSDLCDPLGLAADAPLLAAWLAWMRQAESGQRPVWVRPEIDPGTGLPGAVAVQTVKDALAAHPDACGVILGDPSYIGTTGDLAGHARAAHEAGVPLIVDQAWAAYLGFHPDLPAHAIAAGADGLVTSAHKTLPAYTQGAVVLDRKSVV